MNSLGGATRHLIQLSGGIINLIKEEMWYSYSSKRKSKFYHSHVKLTR